MGRRECLTSGQRGDCARLGLMAKKKERASSHLFGWLEAAVDGVFHQ